jgi:hypothetical protein
MFLAREASGVGTDSTNRAVSERYREIANELRLLVPTMKYSEVAEQLCLLAVSYERLAEHAEGAPHPPQDIEGTLP